MIELLLCWLGLLIACLMFFTPRDGSGTGTLLLAYFLGLSLIHVPGAINFLGEAPGLFDEAETELGFKVTVLGLTALLAGAAIAKLAASRQSSVRSNGAPESFGRFGAILFVVGVVAY